MATAACSGRRFAAARTALPDLLDDLEEARKALLAERERCANLIETLTSGKPVPTLGGYEYLAAAIRKEPK